jgi:hypothetical protein
MTEPQYSWVGLASNTHGPILSLRPAVSQFPERGAQVPLALVTAWVNERANVTKIGIARYTATTTMDKFSFSDPHDLTHLD